MTTAQRGWERRRHCEHCTWVVLAFFGTSVGTFKNLAAATQYQTDHPNGPRRQNR